MPRRARGRGGAWRNPPSDHAAFAANLALYAKLGYAIDRTEPFRGGTAVYMMKRVETAPAS
ncbi:MAG TPA: hypothetical protein VGF57_14150 [Roseiarcus sp.]